MLDHEEWRLGHRRPWWQWNVITLFVLLFALIWTREFLGWDGVWSWIFCILLLIAWFAVPVYVGLQRDFMLANRRPVQPSNEADNAVTEAPAIKRRALIVISIAILWIALLLLALR